MDGANPAAVAEGGGGIVPNAAPAPAPAGSDWRSQLDSKKRDVMKKEIFKILKKHLPLSDPDGPSRLERIAEGYEQKFHNEASSKGSYLRKISMLLMYVENPDQYPHRRAPRLPPQSNNPAQSSAIPLMSQQYTGQSNTSTSAESSSLDSLGQTLTGISQISALQHMSGESAIPQMWHVFMQSATLSGIQQNPMNTVQQPMQSLLQQPLQFVVGQQQHPQFSAHQWSFLQQTQANQQAGIPLQQQSISQQQNLHQNQLIFQQSNDADMPCQGNVENFDDLGFASLNTASTSPGFSPFGAGNANVFSASSSSGAYPNIFENGANREHFVSTWREMETDHFSDKDLDDIMASLNSPIETENNYVKEDGSLPSARLDGTEGPNNASMADGATNLKKRKINGPSYSAPVDDRPSAPVPFFFG